MVKNIWTHPKIFELADGLGTFTHLIIIFKKKTISHSELFCENKWN